MRAPEILAPAGDDDSLDAALGAGADAVYFGLDEGLNARARATNFSAARLPELCDHVHRAGARAYVTLNTLIFEHELAAVEQVLRACALAGVDAIIVQDPAVALLARALAPTLQVHASTQMTISSPEGAAFAAQLGARRVVVPRELSVEEIAAFARGTALELEVFIHGALCMSWSGQCLTSEAWGGRSANRGQCAQSCRLPYQLVVDGEVRELGEIAYLLSPLDLAGARALPALSQLGVASLKIEGRLKGPAAYVSSAVQGYRRWRDAIAAKQDAGAEAQAALQRDLGKMAVAYSRGFSDGFFGGSDHQDLVEGRFPKHRGALLGQVVELAPGAVRVRRAERQASGGAALDDGVAPLGQTKVALPVIAGASPQDSRGVPMEVPEPIPGAGVGFDTGHPQSEEPGGPLFGVEPAPNGWWLRFGRPGPELSRVKVGHRVWLSSDPRLTREAGADVEAGRKGALGRIPVVLEVTGAAGAPLRVTLTAGGPVGGGCAVEGESAEVLTPSTGAGLGVELLAGKLGAMGGTPFRLERVVLEGLGSGLHLPVSGLKALRRGLVQALEAKVLAGRRHEVNPQPAAAQVLAAAAALPVRRAWAAPAPTLIPLVRRAEQLEAVIAAGLEAVELDFMELVGLEKAVARARGAGLKVIIATTRVQKPQEQGVDARFSRLEPDGMLVRHWGALVHFSRSSHPTLVHGDFSLNVTNSVTARHLLSLGADTLTAAHDLDEAQLFALLARAPAERFTVAVHHHIATFHTEHCVYAHTLSHGRDFRTCGRPCEQHQLSLQDPKGQRHPVVVDVNCRNTVFNAQAQSAARLLPRLLSAGVRRYRAEFVWEDQATVADVLEAWRGLLEGRLTPALVNERLSAHEQFGVTAGTMRTLEG
jgi:putative protease